MIAFMEDESLNELFEASENQGDSEGTAAQLDGIRDVLRDAFGELGLEAARDFLNTTAAREFMDDWGPEAD